MKKLRGAVAFGCGLVFAVGLGISGMTRPQKILDFLDVLGNWDPSLAFVMLGALGVTVLTFSRILRRPRPLLDSAFDVPTKTSLDGRLLLGAAIFGVGWGIAGFCPGPAIVSAAAGGTRTLVFVLAMVGAMAAFGFVSTRKSAR